MMVSVEKLTRTYSTGHEIYQRALVTRCCCRTAASPR